MSRPKSETARARALEVAARLAVDEGLAAVTMEEVTRRSGVAKSTIYRHFASRNNLLIAALDTQLPVPVAPDTGQLELDLVAFLEQVRPAFADPQVRALSFEIYAASLRDPELDGLRAAFFTGRMGPLYSVVERAQERGELGRPIDLVDAVGIIEGPFFIWSVTDADRIAAADLRPLARRAAEQLRSLAPG